VTFKVGGNVLFDVTGTFDIKSGGATTIDASMINLN
jgi:hypothetical protein